LLSKGVTNQYKESKGGYLSPGLPYHHYSWETEHMHLAEAVTKDNAAFAYKLHEDTALYRVSDIFASDSAFSMFDPNESPAALASSSKRRLARAVPDREDLTQAGTVLLPLTG
jgi:hypothetical protein